MSEKPLRVLLVEDDAPIAGTIVRALDRRGHRVTVSANADAALAALPQDVIVCDVALAASDAFELCEHALLRSPLSRVVLLSDRATFEICRRALRIGAADLVSKPVQLDELVRSIETAPPVRSRSSAPETGWTRRYTAGAKTVETAVRDLLAYCLRSGIGPTARSRIGTAIAEIVANATEHGYGGRAGEIEIHAQADERTLRVRVRDRGVGFEKLGLYVEGIRKWRDGGLARASALCEEISLDSRPGEGTDVRIAFACHRVDFDEGRRIDLTELDFLSPVEVRGIVDRVRSAGSNHGLHLSPAAAVTIGRLLSGPDPRLAVQGALWS